MPHLQCDTQKFPQAQKLVPEQPPSGGLLAEQLQIRANNDATPNTLDAPRVMVLIILGWQSMLHAVKYRTTSCTMQRAALCHLRILESR